jgi:hypothetical protein
MYPCAQTARTDVDLLSTLTDSNCVISPVLVPGFSVRGLRYTQRANACGLLKYLIAVFIHCLAEPVLQASSYSTGDLAPRA